MAMAIGLVISLAGTAYSTYNQKKTAKANAEMQEKEANYQLARGRHEADAHEAKVRRMMAQQKVNYTASGVSLMSGSVQDVFADTTKNAALDAAVIRSGGKMAAQNAMNSASMYEAQGDAAVAAGVAKAGSTLLSSYNSYNAS